MTSETVLEQELQNIKNQIQPPCVAIIGRTGSGKSSLILEIFGINTTIGTGAGLPKTLFYKKYPDTSENIYIYLYDSPGYEASQTQEFLEATINF